MMICRVSLHDEAEFLSGAFLFRYTRADISGTNRLKVMSEAQ